MMMVSGIKALDERLGGLVPGRAYVLSGAPGTGKTVACLEFIAAHLDDEKRAVMITHDDPSDLISEAQYLGIDLEKALADERLILLRYQLDFVRRYGRAASVDVVFEELRRLVGDEPLGRVVVDSIGPFLEGGPASGAGVSGLLQFLDSLGVTSLITYPGDFSAAYDRRLESMMQRAAGIFHLSTDADRTGRLEIRKVRYQVPSTSPFHYRIEPGVGIVAIGDLRSRRASDLADDSRRKILVLDLTSSFPAELLHAVRAQYDVAVRTGVASSYSDLVTGVGAVLIDVRRDSINDVLALVRELRRGLNRAPIILVTQFRMRSDDRARALRAGADDFISADLHPDEFLLRLAAAVRRGHSATDASPEQPLVLQPSNGNGPAPLIDTQFRDAVDEHLGRDRAAFFTVVSIRPLAGPLDALVALALESVRVDGGDLVGVDGDHVMVYLHSARRKDVVPFIERLRAAASRAGCGDIAVDTAVYPVDAERVHELVHGTPAIGGGDPDAI